MSVLRLSPYYHFAMEADKHIVRCFELLAAFDATGCRHAASKAVSHLEKLDNIFGDNLHMIEAFVEILILSGKPSRCWDFLPDGSAFKELRERITRIEILINNNNSYGANKMELDFNSVLDIMNSLSGTAQMLIKAFGDPKLIEDMKGI